MTKPVIRFKANCTGVMNFKEGKLIRTSSRVIVPAWKAFRDSLPTKKEIKY